MRGKKESEIIYYLACSPVTRPNLWYQIINYLRKEDGDAVNIHYKLCNATKQHFVLLRIAILRKSPVNWL